MNRQLRFFRWFRTIPILAMALVGALSVGLVEAPTSVVRGLLLPIDHRQEILDSSSRHGVDPLLVCAIIKCESNWNEAAVSDAGAVGLMQLMPETAAELANFGVVDGWTYDCANLTDATTNIEYGCAYLQQLQQNLSSTSEVIAAYNAGPGSVEQWLQGGGDIADVIDFPETALYLTRVNETYEQYQKYYDAGLNQREA